MPDDLRRREALQCRIVADVACTFCVDARRSGMRRKVLRDLETAVDDLIRVRKQMRRTEPDDAK